MAKWISSDYHFGDDRLGILGRACNTEPNIEAFMGKVIYNHNQLVTKDDEVIVVGDVLFKDRLQYLPWIAYMYGKKTLIRGNHDRWLTDEQLKPYFDVIIPDGEGMELDVEGIPCYAVHYPTRGRADRFNLTGHIHSAWKYQLNMLNVGIDVHHFYPVNLETIPKHLKAICEYYDEDVWVGYKDVNASFIGKRGKKGNYFDNR